MNVTELTSKEIIIEMYGQGPAGKTGNGIASIELLSEVGLVKTYRISYTNGQYFDFPVEDGNGIASVTKTGTDVLTDTYTIVFTNGTSTTFDVVNGNGIIRIEKTGTDVLTDTYTIYYTNGTTASYTVKNGKGISSIRKTGTSGLVDTYTISYNDGTSSTFTVTNGEKGDTGNGIASISKTGTSGLVDTYTITYTNEQTATFTVTNGNGITKIQKTGTSGLTDTYTITFQNGTTTTYQVVNGNGISSITKTGTSGLVDTYTIAYTNGTSTTFTVTNGEKGDTGNGIQSIEKTATVGLVDTYTITMTDGTTTTFTVTNGSDMWGNITGTLSDQTDLQNALDSKAPVIAETASGSIASFTDGSPAPVTALTVGIEPVQQGDGDPSPDNVRPISGWTGTNIRSAGKNLFKTTAETETKSGVTFTVNNDGSVTISGTPISGNTNKNLGIVTLPAGNYKVNGFDYGSRTGTRLQIFDVTDGAQISIDLVYEGHEDVTISLTKQTPILLRLFITKSFDGNSITAYPQIRLASDPDASWSPQQGTTLPISWQTEAGTVYGGVLDVLTGMLTVDRVMVDLGTLSWVHFSPSGQIIFDYFKTTISGIKYYSANILAPYKCSQYKTTTATQIGKAGFDKCIAQSGTIVFIADSAYTDASDFKTAMNGVQLVYELAEPFTVQLDASTLETLKGENHVFADTGNIDLTYRADTKLFIEEQIAESQRATRSLIAGIETAMVASKNYSTGDLLIVGDTLYKTTANIGSGSAITVGTNVTATTVAEQLIALANA